MLFQRVRSFLLDQIIPDRLQLSPGDVTCASSSIRSEQEMLSWFCFPAHCCHRSGWCLANSDLTSQTTTLRLLAWTNTSFQSISLCLIQHYMTLVIPEHTHSFSAGVYQLFLGPVSWPPCLFCAVLIKLKKQDGRCAKRTPFISPICLPDKNTTFPDYFCCTISGWGHMHESEF